MNEVPKIFYTEVLRRYFAMDIELISKFHIEAPATVEECAERTANDLLENNVVLYDLNDKGYFGVEDGKHLTSFFIVPEYRTQDFIPIFWSSVESKLGKKFLCGLYNKNLPAINFIQRAGGKPLIASEKFHGMIYLVERK